MPRYFASPAKIPARRRSPCKKRTKIPKRSRKRSKERERESRTEGSGITKERGKEKRTMRTGCLPSKTQQSIRRIGTSRNSAAARYPPRQPLNLWRCDNVDAAFCMLDCCRIHSRFPSLLPSRSSRQCLFAPSVSRARFQTHTPASTPALYSLLHYNSAITVTTTIATTTITVLSYLP